MPIFLLSLFTLVCTATYVRGLATMPIFLLSLFTLVCTATYVRGQLDGRIVGGETINRRCESPYNSLVALKANFEDTERVICSAVMIDSQHLVTSGHCIESYTYFGLSIHAIVGERDLYLTEPYQQDMTIAVGDIKLHNGYNKDTGDNNLALLRLPRPAKLSQCVQPATALAFDPSVAEDNDESCIMMGWGPFSDDNSAANSRLPRQARVRVLGELPTRISYLLQFGLLQPAGNVLAEALMPNQKACLFDRGGMVSCKRNGFYGLRGVIAESNCVLQDTGPILATDVPAYKSWIEDCLQNWDRCPSANLSSLVEGSTSP